MQLPINALGMGFSTKDVQHHLVGRHGEGLKLASLILSRDGCQVSIAASGCNWRFDMHTDCISISCTVALSQKTKSIQWADPALDMVNLRSHVERDVAVVIGPARTKWPTSRAGRVFELAPLDDDGHSRAHLPVRYHFHTTGRLDS
jgi:hypothetical protein